MNICGIYKITNTINNKSYFGQSIDCKKRLQEHRRKLKYNKHENQYLQNSYNKYGGNNFKYDIVLLCNIQDLDGHERYFIEVNKSDVKQNGYNIELGGNLKKQVSEETKKKISQAGKGRIVTEETRNKISKSTKGKIVSTTTRLKLSDANMGKIRTEETLKILSESHKGHKHTDEHKRKISESHKGKQGYWLGKTKSPESIKKFIKSVSGENHHFHGKKFTEQHKKKLSESRIGKYCGINNPSYGKVVSEETRRKLSNANLGRKASEETRQKLCKARVKKPILQKDINGNTIKQWDSILIASKTLNINSGSICNCCKGSKSNAGGFKWEYVNKECTT